MVSHAAPNSPYDTSKLRRLWLPFLTSLPIYAAILFLVDSGSSSSNPGFLRMFTIVLGTLAFAELLFVFLAKGLLASLTGGNYQTFCIVRWALLESIAVFGLILHFVGASAMTGLVFLAVALATLVISGPKPDEAAEVAPARH